MRLTTHTGFMNAYKLIFEDQTLNLTPSYKVERTLDNSKFRVSEESEVRGEMKNETSSARSPIFPSP